MSHGKHLVNHIITVVRKLEDNQTKFGLSIGRRLKMVRNFVRRCVKLIKNSGPSCPLNQAMIVGTKSGASIKKTNNLGERIKTVHKIKLPGLKPGIKIITRKLNSQLDFRIC